MSFLVYRGSRIAFKTTGKGRAIVLIHGFLGSQKIWDEYAMRLSKNFRIITIDLPGHGESESLGYIHEMELLADLVKFLLKTINVRKAVLVGHSLGGYISLAFAEKYPDSVLGLIMVNSTAKGDSKEKIKGRNQLINLLKKGSDRPLELLVPSFFNVLSQKTRWFRLRYLNMAKKANKSGVVSTLECMKIRKEREIVLKFAPFPYLYLIGKEDKIFNYKELINESQLNEKGSYSIFENSSHMIFWEEKEKCFKRIKDFSKKLSS